MKRFYIWIDESGTPRAEIAPASDAERVFSVGMLLRTEPLSATLIDQALERLREDSDAVGNPQDRETLERAYFHASMDSKNAHSHVCAAAAASGPALFEFFSFDRAAAPGIHRDLLADSRTFHRSMVELLATRISATRTSHVQIMIAEHAHSFATNTVAFNWKVELWHKLIGATAQLPQLPTFFPDVTVATAPPSEPGVQLVDFLLWAALRKRTNPRDPWLDRSMFQPHWEWAERDGPLSGHEYLLGGDPDDDPPLVDAKIIRKPRDEFTNEEVLEVLIGVERQVRHLGALPEHAAHLLPHVQDCLCDLNHRDVSFAALKKLAETYFLLVDTVPLYDPLSPEDVGRAIDAKEIVGVTWLRDTIRWFFITKRWWRVRMHIFDNDPAALGL